MKDLKRRERDWDSYPFIDLKTYQMGSIPKAKFHDLMNSQPKVTIDNPSQRNLELLFRLTLTKLLAAYERNKTNVEFGDLISDAYLIFMKRFEKFDSGKSNWFSYCEYIRMDLENKYKTDHEKSKYFVRIDPEEIFWGDSED